MMNYAKPSWLLRGLSLVCAALMLPAAGLFSIRAAAESGTAGGGTDAGTENGAPQAAASASGGNTYRLYRQAHETAALGEGTITVPAADMQALDGAQKRDTYEGRSNVLLLEEETGRASFTFTIPRDGLYRVSADYFPVATGSYMEANLSFTIDGEAPFEEAATIFLPKIFVSEHGIEQDHAGNDILPRQVEAPRWMTADFIDNSGFYADPFLVYLTAGQHTMSMEMTKETAAFSAVRFSPPETLPTYAQVQQEYADKGYAAGTGELTIIQGEDAAEKTDSSIAPEAGTYSSNALLEPSDPNCSKLNVLSYDKPGHYATWNIQVDESGLYRIGMRILQNNNRGMSIYRRLRIDGEVPFQEAEAIEIPYTKNWDNYILGGDTPYLFYFEAGREYEFSLEVTTGELAETIGALNDTVMDLSTVSRQITSVTGMTPDNYRDYQLDVAVPDLIPNLQRIRDSLVELCNRFDPSLRDSGSALVTAEDMIRQLEDFIDTPRDIPPQLSNFRVNVSTLSTWVNSLTYQWMAIDLIAVLPENAAMPRARANFWEQAGFEIRSIVGSFFRDYSYGAGGENSKSITVWITGGRDQANVMRRLIDNEFTPGTGIGVSLSLVADTATLLQATLGGKGPDAAIMVAKDLPVNLAARGALVDLSTFPEFAEMEERFYPSALVPYRYNGGVYGVPNGQGFFMMFCRTDILEEYGMSIPETWDDFYKMLPTLQRNNMQVGAGGDAVAYQYVFETLLFQFGGQLYRDDRSATALDSVEALEAFKMWTGLYTEYSLPLTYDIYSYFRSGSIPLFIADYTQYNLISAAAPELKGKWVMAPIPGIRQEDGSIRRLASSSGTAGVLLKAAEDKESAFQFLNWLTTEETQTRYSVDLESAMGIAARYNSANRETMKNIGWSKSEYEALSAMWENVRDFPILPSNYYISRNINNAFRAVVHRDENPRETLSKYAGIIDKEITRKNRDLGIGGEAS